MCSSRKYPYFPHRIDSKFHGGWGVSKAQKLKAMYEAKLEFPEGWGGGVIGQIPSMGDMDILWNYTILDRSNLKGLGNAR